MLLCGRCFSLFFLVLAVVPAERHGIVADTKEKAILAVVPAKGLSYFTHTGLTQRQRRGRAMLPPSAMQQATQMILQATQMIPLKNASSDPKPTPFAERVRFALVGFKDNLDVMEIVFGSDEPELNGLNFGPFLITAGGHTIQATAFIDTKTEQVQKELEGTVYKIGLSNAEGVCFAYLWALDGTQLQKMVKSHAIKSFSSGEVYMIAILKDKPHLFWLIEIGIKKSRDGTMTIEAKFVKDVESLDDDATCTDPRSADVVVEATTLVHTFTDPGTYPHGKTSFELNGVDGIPYKLSTVLPCCAASAHKLLDLVELCKNYWNGE